MTLTGDTAGLLALSGPPGADSSARVIQTSLSTLRRHLDMEVGFVGRFERGRRVFEYVDADLDDCPVQPQHSDPVEETYCGRVADGSVPEIIPDARREPGVADLEATWQMPIGAHIAVPLHRANGEVLGTVCCFSRTPDHSLGERDLGLMRLFADLLSVHLETQIDREEQVDGVRRRVQEVIDGGGPTIAVQPIVNIGTGGVVGYEALSRFDRAPSNPQQWFDDAGSAGVGAELEASAVANALALMAKLPEHCSLSVNVTADSLTHKPLLELLLAHASRRLVVEVTEQLRVEDYLALGEPIGQLRAAGGRVAVDDAGAGYAGLQHILQLQPEVVKLDRCLVHGVADDPARRAMIVAMVGFAQHTDADLVAEGVEDFRDALTLAELGVPLGQGYHFGRPSTALSR